MRYAPLYGFHVFVRGRLGLERKRFLSISIFNEKTRGTSRISPSFSTEMDWV
jgi:hypothetical protein